MRILLIFCVLLSGCTFCREHTATCTTLGAIGATSLALSFKGGSHQPAAVSASLPPSPDCKSNPEVCK